MHVVIIYFFKKTVEDFATYVCQSDSSTSSVFAKYFCLCFEENENIHKFPC